MRNPDRIDRIIEELRQEWHRQPDSRLCQLVSNTVGLGPQDIFYVEDSTFEQRLLAFRRPISGAAEGAEK